MTSFMGLFHPQRRLFFSCIILNFSD